MSFSRLSAHAAQLLSVFFLCFTGQIAWAYEPAANELKLIVERQGIKIWSYRLPNSSLSGFKAITTVKSTLSGLVSLIADTQAGNRWIYRASEVELLQRNDPDMTFTVRVITDFPWPLKDREALVAGKIVQDPQTLKVRIDSHNVDTFPVAPCCLRMPLVDGTWIFRPLGNGMVEVTMMGHADPGGMIPASLVNLLVQEHPYNSLKGLRRIIGEDRYQRSHFLNIREPAN